MQFQNRESSKAQFLKAYSVVEKAMGTLLHWLPCFIEILKVGEEYNSYW